MEELRNNEPKQDSVSEQSPYGLMMKRGNTTFFIGLHYSETSKETLEDKMKMLIRRDVESGNF